MKEADQSRRLTSGKNRIAVMRKKDSVGEILDSELACWQVSIFSDSDRLAADSSDQMRAVTDRQLYDRVLIDALLVKTGQCVCQSRSSTSEINVRTFFLQYGHMTSRSSPLV